MVGGILYYGVGQAKRWDIWRIIYVLCGRVTVVWSGILFFYLPDNVLTAKRFSVEERAMLIAWTAAYRTGVYNRKIKTEHTWEVFCDAQVWLAAVLLCLAE